ncbi:hypothetical protein HPB49_006414 [Dermacentor silvarum]|uniref:Uncharacterized protein n=1 Tax=Dermacentor silvarum TaxID=543639 RepID=A0ACB8DMW5_DERSI|nr:hypothetical protein HPB49_006414 [Dermacentor silvarum]
MALLSVTGSLRVFLVCQTGVVRFKAIILVVQGKLVGQSDAADASALEILERIAANGDNSDLDLSDSEDSADGAEANEQCDGILDEEEQDCHYDSDTDVDDGDDGVSNPVMHSRERWPRKQVYASVLPDLPEVPSSTAGERDGWYANQYYTRYIDDQAFELLHEMTEVSYLQRTGRSLNSSPGEMKVFLGATLLMSCLGYPRARMYWSQGTRVAAVADKITRDRFFLMRSNLKVVDDLAVSDGEKEADRLWKVRPLLNIIRNACLKLPRSPNICVDEQIIPFTGKCPVKQFVPGKPNPTGLKNFILASPQGLVLDFEIFQGKGSLAQKKQHGIGAAVVLKLAETLPCGSLLYFDRYFTGTHLLESLAEKNIRGTGTIMKSRLPKGLKLEGDREMRAEGRGAMSQCVSTVSNICITNWYDNKPIVLASTHVGMEPVDDCTRFSKQERKKVVVKRPAVVAEYNTYMGGVDLCDRMLSFYPTTMRTKKWTIRTLIFMMDVGVVNSWLLYKQDHRELGTQRKNIMQLLDFKLELAHFLLASDKGFSSTESDCEAMQLRKPAVVPLPSPSVRTLSASHMPEIVDQKSASRCRNPGCCERTKLRCCKCNLFLCLTAGRNCFKAFHKK